MAARADVRCMRVPTGDLEVSLSNWKILEIASLLGERLREATLVGAILLQLPIPVELGNRQPGEELEDWRHIGRVALRFGQAA